MRNSQTDSLESAIVPRGSRVGQFEQAVGAATAPDEEGESNQSDAVYHCLRLSPVSPLTFLSPHGHF